jgi:hypothetical protein
MADHGTVSEAIGALALVDHHVHQALGADVPRAAFEEQISESDRPAPPGTTQFDSAPAEEYLARRAGLGRSRPPGCCCAPRAWPAS